MIKVIKSLLVIALVFLCISGTAHAQIFEGFEGEWAPYGFCLDDANKNDIRCYDIECSGKDKEDTRCISQAQAGTIEAKESLTGPGITHTDNLGDLIIKYVNFALPYLTLAAFVGFVVAGFFYVTAYGNEQQLEKAKKILIWSVVGLLLVIASYTIIQFLTSELVKFVTPGK
jgi:hypothetical protein